MDTERDEINETEVDTLPTTHAGSPRRAIAMGALVLALIGIVFVIWFTLIRDDNSGTTAEVSVSSDQSANSGGVGIIQIPSLAATATVDGVPADGAISPIALTFGEPSELVVTVVNDGNITMDDITVTLEITADDTSGTEAPDPCALPVLAPEDSAVCALEFRPTSSMSAVVARVLGYGPQRQEVELSVNIALDS